MRDLSVEYASELVRGVVELLWSRPEGLSGDEVIARLPEKIQLTEDLLNDPQSLFSPRYTGTVRLATLPLVKAGWLIKTDKGRWILTEDGRAACRRFLTPHELYLEAKRLQIDGQNDISRNLIFLEVIREEGWGITADYIKGKNSVEIRRLIALLLDAMQFHITWIAPPQKERGQIDMIASIDPIGANARRILVQIKHTGQPVTLEGIRSFLSVLGSDDFGLLFSSGGFTSEVRDAENKKGYQKINIMDLEKFYDIWLKYYDKLSREAHILLPLQTIFFLSPQNEANS